MRACAHSLKEFLPGKVAGVIRLLLLAAAVFPAAGFAQMDYVARFKMEKSKYLLGEPVFCEFSIRNTGTQAFVFSYRFPSRAVNRQLEAEPNFTVTASDGHELTDPAPRPCGGAQGTVVYGSVTLPPGATHTEMWLLDQWARFTRPGKYHVHAERHLPLKSLDEATHQASSKPAAYALAINDLTFEIAPSTTAERRTLLLPYRKALFHPDSENFAEAFLVAVTLPQPLFLERLQALARAPVKEHRWDRQQALEGLARLGTRAAWQDILNIARDGKQDEALRAYAILLVGERADPATLPAMIRLLAAAPVSLQDDILRALGFFRDPRANQLLFEKLHSRSVPDRVNAILGLRNLESKEAIPALLAMLSDPNAQVRLVANFALQSLTGEKFKLSDSPGRSESTAVAKQWHDWWLKHEAGFEPVHQPACHDW